VVSITRFLIARKLYDRSAGVTRCQGLVDLQVVLVDVVLSTPPVRDVRVGV